ncbi:MAG TPA: hypothetical protein VE734_08610 [Terriglobales bacterium]|nr:hypothetical protein [Terriglobales bacterium]
MPSHRADRQVMTGREADHPADPAFAARDDQSALIDSAIRRGRKECGVVIVRKQMCRHRELAQEYRKATGRIPEIYVTTAPEGARRCEPPGSLFC